MKLLLFLLLLAVQCTQVRGQFYILRDADGYVNVRGENGAVINRLDSGTIVWREMPDCQWSEEYGYYVGYYHQPEEIYKGNIHESRLFDVMSFETVPVIDSDFDSLGGSNYVKLGNEIITITIEKEKFSTQKNKVIYNDEDFPHSINGYTWWNGNPGRIPYEQIKSLDIRWKGKQVEIPYWATDDLFDISLRPVMTSYDRETDTLYMIIGGGDGGEGYIVLFVFEHGVYKQRYL